MRLLLLPAVAALAIAGAAAAQPQTVLFPGQSGAELRASLRAAYRPASLNGTNDDLYAVIDRTSVGGLDGVVCVYTGHFVPFDCSPSCDPSQDVFNNGAGINQEHTWPQSQLNGSGSSPAEEDLQHIFPARVVVNADRGNSPFGEIPDEQTSRWYRDATSQPTMPPPPLDEWSELLGSQGNAAAFEPREVHEGNTARALYYVQTMYDEHTGDAWFEPQMRTLYEWSYLDPIDQAEYDRTLRVAQFQSNQPNPFVLDSTLIRRAFFPEIVAAGEGPAPAASVLTVAPTVFTSSAVVTLTPLTSGHATVEVWDPLGRRVARLFHGTVSRGVPITLRLAGDGLGRGALLVRAVVDGRSYLVRSVRH